jgi:hypothetical protein
VTALLLILVLAQDPPAAACTKDAECALVSANACGSCCDEEPSAMTVKDAAAERSRRARVHCAARDCSAVKCKPRPHVDYVAACEQSQCVKRAVTPPQPRSLLELSEEARRECTKDSECTIEVPRSCCPTCCPSQPVAMAVTSAKMQEQMCAQQGGCRAPMCSNTPCPPVRPAPTRAVCRQGLCVGEP